MYILEKRVGVRAKVWLRERADQAWPRLPSEMGLENSHMFQTLITMSNGSYS